MAEGSNVRLVRCPKCENLLTELPEFSLYQCGGCGAVLKAKKKGILEDGLSEMSNDVKGGEVSEEDSIVKASEADMESADQINGSRIERIHNEELDSNGTSASQAEGRKLAAGSDTNRRGKERIRRTESFDDEYQPYSQGLVHNRRNHGKNRDPSAYGPDYARFPGPHIRSEVELSRPRPVSGPDRGGHVSSQAMYDDFRYGDVGPSSYGMNPDYDERHRYGGRDMDELARIENLEIDKAELLKKLDELKDKINRSSEMVDPSKQRIGNGRRMVPPASYVQEGLSSSRGGFIPYADGYGPRGMDTYPQRGYPHEFVHYDNSNNAYKHETFRGPPSRPHAQYMQRPYHDPYYSDANHDLFMLHRHENFFHQPACSCVHCCDRNKWHNMPHEVEPLNLHNRRPQNEPSSNPNLHHHLNPVMHRPNEDSFGRPLQSRQSLTLNSNEMDSENDGFSNRPRKLVVAHRSGRLSRPIAGGAPFVACSSCFELLKLQRKHISLGKDQQKMKCGACSSIIVFELGNAGFIASQSAHVDQIPTEIDEGSSGTVDENVGYWNDALNADVNVNAFSDDYDDSHHKFSATENNKSEFGESEKQLDPLSSTSSLSGKSQENTLSRNGSQSLDLRSTKVKSFTDNESSPKELADHSPENLVVRRSDKLSQSKRPEQERVSLDRTASGQSSVKDATEIDVPLNEFSNSYASQDSVEVSKEAPTTKGNKGGESFFAGLIKKSFKKSNGESQVFVNGHLIPERAVKKAEKLAGPIQPGEYWYDKQAGFWGVMGHSCLGIVMPNILEFNYPLPKNCAAGNTGVFVNGRELHQKDLDLLASRGLPITRNRSYIVEITGSVVDEQTGEELDGLGKLAPTVERAKHGFGMKVPRFLAQS